MTAHVDFHRDGFDLEECLRRVLGVDTLPAVDPATKRINDQARDVPGEDHT